MELKRALAIRTEMAGHEGLIRVDAENYICLNEMNAFFPDRRLDVWMKTGPTQEFISIVERQLKLPPGSGIISRRGRNGGTWAHHLIAFEFAMWLSPEFKLKVYQEYTQGTQRKQDWNIKRILAANHYKVMTEAVKNAHDPAKHYHYSNEALMINEIIFGVRDGDIRDTATEEQLDRVSDLEMHNSTLIKIGMDYATRKKTLEKIAGENNTLQLPNETIV